MHSCLLPSIVDVNFDQLTGGVVRLQIIGDENCEERLLSVVTHECFTSD